MFSKITKNKYRIIYWLFQKNLPLFSASNINLISQIHTQQCTDTCDAFTVTHIVKGHTLPGMDISMFLSEPAIPRSATLPLMPD